MIIVIVPGRGPLNAVPLPNNPTTLMIELVNPQLIHNFCVTLSEPLGVGDVGVGIYALVAPYIDYEYLGYLSNDHPSDIFKTDWIYRSPEVFQQQPIRLGMTVEPLQKLIEMSKAVSPDAEKMNYVKKVALSLFRYIESFGGRADQNVLDSWFRRFQEKSRLDPNFVARIE